jgi:hypothetical protein
MTCNGVLSVSFYSLCLGAEGKLSGLPQKLSLVTCVANFSQCAVSGTSTVQALATSVVELFITLLQNEGGEVFDMMRVKFVLFTF